MKLGFMCGMANNGQYTIDEIVDEIARAEALGFDHAWMAQVFSTDAITALAIAGRETRRIGLGTAVVPSYPRHPTALALQVLTASAACGGRFELGLGLSHKLVIEDMFGLSYARPARHMREYLGVLMPLLRGEPCAFAGDEYRVQATFKVPGAEAVPVLVAALGPRMLEIAGQLADGTITWMAGPLTLERHIIPSIREAAAAAGKPAPRVVAGLPIVLTDDPAGARAALSRTMAVYGQLPSYRRMLAIEGIDDPVDIALLGDEVALRGQLDRLAHIGVTDFNAFCSPVDPQALARTRDFLAGERERLAEIAAAPE